jgi:hypothetical protein
VEKWIDRWMWRRTERQAELLTICGQADRKTDRRTDKKKERLNGQTERRMVRKTEIEQTNGRTNRQKDVHAEN